MKHYPSPPTLVLSYHELRRAIGWLCLLLPFALILGTISLNYLYQMDNQLLVHRSCKCFYTPDDWLKPSICHYYYSIMSELYTSGLCAIAVLLYCYKGYEQRSEEFVLSDSNMTNFAATCLLGMIVFPVSSDSCITDNTRTFISSEAVGYLHCTFAGFFMFSAALIVLFNFRRTESVENFGKMPSHEFYRNCGIIMLICLGLLVFNCLYLEDAYPPSRNFCTIIVLQTLAMVAFGSSWLKKGNTNNN